MSPIKPTHKSILAYYATLKELSDQNVSHEMGMRRAFQELLADTAKLHDWTLVTEDAFKTPASGLGKGATIRPDATLRDKNTLPRGFWEAKDTNDSLHKEIAKKTAKGYSLGFEGAVNNFNDRVPDLAKGLVLYDSWES